MREYVITDLRPEETEALQKNLRDRGYSAGLDGLYWLPLPEDILTPLQSEHPACGPHAVGLEVFEMSVRCELLVRARNNLRCDCIAMATPEQTVAVITTLHAVLRELGIEF